jgi:hypothetical protein
VWGLKNANLWSASPVQSHLLSVVLALPDSGVPGSEAFDVGHGSPAQAFKDAVLGSVTNANSERNQASSRLIAVGIETVCAGGATLTFIHFEFTRLASRNAARVFES